MPSSICYQLRPVLSSSPSLLLALRGSRGARMNPAGEAFPSRPKGWSGPTLPLSWDAPSNLRLLSSATGPHPSHQGNLFLFPVSTTQLLQRWAAPSGAVQTPLAVGAAGTDSPPAQCSVSAAHHTWLGMASCTLSTSILLAGSHLLRLSPSLSPLWYVTFLGVFMPAKDTL